MSAPGVLLRLRESDGRRLALSPEMWAQPCVVLRPGEPVLVLARCPFDHEPEPALVLLLQGTQLGWAWSSFGSNRAVVP